MFRDGGNTFYDQKNKSNENSGVQKVRNRNKRVISRNSKYISQPSPSVPLRNRMRSHSLVCQVHVAPWSVSHHNKFVLVLLQIDIIQGKIVKIYTQLKSGFLFDTP
jgi:hypothetical protein